MDKKSKNTLIVSIIALALVMIGVTYAYFNARITGLESASIIRLTSGRMSITYAEGDESVVANNIYPREEEWITKTITLTGYNSTDQEMKYELGLNITSNTFKGGQLTFDLTGVGSNGTKIADISGKSIVGSNRFFKFGTGSFVSADGDTHVYTLKIYFKDNGKDQNFNQEAVFNAKISVKEYGSSIATQNHNGRHCYTDNYIEGVSPADRATYINGQYTYNYGCRASYSSWTCSGEDGWGVMLTDKTSTDPVTTELCAYIDEKPVKGMEYMFLSSKATSIDLGSFDTSRVTNMQNMFSNCSATTLDLSSFDTSNVIDMSYMFSDSKATSIDLSSFDTSNVLSMGFMFRNTVATSLDLSSFDTSKVMNMSVMFAGSQATSLDLSSFDTSNVTDMLSMFNGAQATSIDLSSFNTSKAISMDYMFNGVNLITLNLTTFDTSRVTSMRRMFKDSANLTTILVSNSFVTSSLPATDNASTGAGGMFSGCSSLVGGEGTVYDSNHIAREYAHIDGGLSNPGYFTDYNSVS